MNNSDRRCIRCGEYLSPGQQICSNGHVVSSNGIQYNQGQNAPVHAANNPIDAIDPTILPSGKKPGTPHILPSEITTGEAAQANHPTPIAPPPAPNIQPIQPVFPAQGSIPNGAAYPGYPPPPSPYPQGQQRPFGQPGQTPYAYPGQPQQPQPPYIPGQPGPIGYQANAGNPPYVQPPYGAYPQPQKRRSAGKTLFIVGGVILAVVVVLCVSVSTLVQGHLKDAANVTTPKIATPPAEPTSPASVRSVPTPTDQALFSDDFANNSNSWNLDPGNGYTVTIADHALKIHNTGSDVLVKNVPGNDNWGDVRFDATYIPNLPDANDVVGIVFHGQDAGSNGSVKGYLLEIDSQGDYYIRKSSATGNDFTDLKKGQMDKPPLLGTPINVTLIMIGNGIAVYLNGTLVESFTDSSQPVLSKGYIGLYTIHNGSSGSTDAAFSHVDVYPAPASMPTK